MLGFSRIYRISQILGFSRLYREQNDISYINNHSYLDLLLFGGGLGTTEAMKTKKLRKQRICVLVHLGNSTKQVS